MKNFSINKVHAIAATGLALGVFLYFKNRDFHFLEFLKFILCLAILEYILTAIGEVLRNYAKDAYVPDSKGFFSRLFERLFWDIGPPTIGMTIALIVVWVNLLPPIEQDLPATLDDIASNVQFDQPYLEQYWI